MATTIADNVGKITFVVGGSTYDVDKSDIKYIYLNKEKKRIEVRVASGIITGNYIFIVYSDVTSPTDKAVGALYKTIMRWWTEPGFRSAKFIAYSSQDTFDCTPRIKVKPDSMVLVDGSSTLFPFTVTGNTVVFDDPMDGYEEVEIFE